MKEEFSPKDPYEVQAAWDTVMTAIEEIRAEQTKHKEIATIRVFLIVSLFIRRPSIFV